MPNSGWTRRAALVHLARAGVLLGQQAPPAAAVRPAHPRLILPDAELPRLQALIREHPRARKMAAELRRESEKLLNAPPLESRSFPRLPGESRRVLDRVYLLGLLYRLEHETAHLARAVRELNAAAESRDPNAFHPIEIAELTMALAIGYDWLWPELKPEERALFRDAIVNRGLKAVLPWYQKPGGWVVTAGVTNTVVNAGMGLGALAVAEDEPDLSAAILKYALDSLARSFTPAGLEGGWLEAPGAWSFATQYTAGFLSALETAGSGGSDASVLRGLERAARYRVYAMGPQGRTFAAAPGPEPVADAPEMFWLARRLRQPALAWSEQRELARAQRANALDLVWYVRDAAPPQPPAWPLDAVFPAQQRAFLRSSWDDPQAIFVGVKGGDNRAFHPRGDLGSFVLDAFGVRWALDPERPLAPPARAPAVWHNTLAIDDENQDPAAEARLAAYDFTPALAWVGFDLTRAYAPKLKLWQRRVGLAERQAILIEDRVRAQEPVEVSWSMLTDAEIAFSGQTALLSKDSALLAAEIQTPRHAVFDVTQAGPNKRRLVASMGEKTTDVDLHIVLTPYKAGQPRPRVTARLPE